MDKFTKDILIAVAAELASHSGALGEVAVERVRQDQRWGAQNHPDGTGRGGERLANARELCREAAEYGWLTWRHILEEEVSEALAETGPAQLRDELVQVAAVAVAWVEAIDRRKARGETDGQFKLPLKEA